MIRILMAVRRLAALKVWSVLTILHHLLVQSVDPVQMVLLTVTTNVLVRSDDFPFVVSFEPMVMAC